MLDDRLKADRPSGSLGGFVQGLDTLIRYCSVLILCLSLFAMLLPACLNAGLCFLSGSRLERLDQWVSILLHWFVMAGTVLVTQYYRQIGLQLLPLRAGSILGKMLCAAIHFMIVVICMLVFWFGIDTVILMDNSQIVLPIKMQAWGDVVMLIGCVLVGLSSLTGLYRVMVTAIATLNVNASPF